MSKRPSSVKALESLGRERLSQNFFMRDFLHSEIASFYGLQNIPDDPDLLSTLAGTSVRNCSSRWRPSSGASPSALRIGPPRSIGWVMKRN